MRQGYSVERIHELTKIDRWFLYKLYNIVMTADELETCDELKSIPEALLRQAKEQGFSKSMNSNTPEDVFFVSI